MLIFNEEVNQNFASVAVTAGDDRTNRVTGEPMVDGETVTARVDDLAPGAYTVGYRVTSADGHVVSGSSVFTVADAEGGAGADGARPVLTAVARLREVPGLRIPMLAVPRLPTPVASRRTPMRRGRRRRRDLRRELRVNPVIWVVGGLAVLLIGGAFVLLRRGGGSGS
ncbi:copper resistance CopC family protein [Dietzia lutea]|uniref:copper resistance CopC family protein n=1 Tax=Dietzia lutea TaxID=546160 RepID=UPI001FC97154|nr:copper resistance CopC family protein [Dietzia lutea]